MRMWGLGIGLLLGLASLAMAEPPRSRDDRLSVNLFAAEPDIVTPTGIAVDRRGRVFCIESHTHFRPDDYEGPPADRIRIFEDTDGDDRADAIRTFFEGTKWTMNLAFDRDGSLVVATRYEVFRLRDRDGDDKADEKTTLVRLDTPGQYPHNGLGGLAFDAFGNLYIGLGENLGESYSLVGSDGTTLEGGGEGGNIYRCRPDGSGLVRIATGFWNPFALAFDPFGRLFAVDNDPDSRPPCRLLHIVAGGDYGFRFRNGRKGLHPFTSWNGELPGTLPMVCGTGEAPSGLVVYESDGLPEEYRGSVLVTSWGDHRLERYRLQARGASFGSTLEPVLVGGEDFRPVGIAVAPDGSLYLSDWVDKSYPLHGKGRIWHVRRKAPQPRAEPSLDHPDRHIREEVARGANDALLRMTVLDDLDPRGRASALAELIRRGEKVPPSLDDPDPGVRGMAVRALPPDLLDQKADQGVHDPAAIVRAAALRRWSLRDDPEASKADVLAVLLPALESDDPFLRQGARESLKRWPDVSELVTFAREADYPRRRLGLLLVLRDLDTPEAREALPRFLNDPDPDVRFAAIQWVGERGLEAYRPALVKGLAGGAVTRQLFEGYLAALERLDGTGRLLNQEIGGQEYVAALLHDPATPDAVRRRALRVLQPDHPALTLERLRGFLQTEDPGLRLEAVRTLRESPHEGRLPILLDLARDPGASETLRAEAVVGLSGDEPRQRETLLALATDGPPSVRREALRSLRGVTLTDAQRETLEQAAQGDEAAQSLLATLNATDRFPDAPRADEPRRLAAAAGRSWRPVGRRAVVLPPEGAGLLPLS